MADYYQTIYKPGKAEVIEKKSRFIATVSEVHTKEEAEQFIAACKKKYFDARHNCSAYVINGEVVVSHCSDDGEPSGTAGRPMLDVILSREIRNVCIVVTRYFGGTLLGTGGLVRAYQKAVIEALDDSVLVEKHKGVKVEIVTNYNDVGKLQYFFAQNKIVELASEYTEKVSFFVLIPEEEQEVHIKKIVELTAAKASITTLNEVIYAKIQGEIKLFPY